MSKSDHPRPVARGKYQITSRFGQWVFTSAIGPLDPDAPQGFSHFGRVGSELDLEAGREAAAVAARNVLGALTEELGSLSAVHQLVHVRGYVASPPDFTEHATVIDAASEVFHEALGERGAHSRTSTGVSSLPFGIPVVIEVVAIGKADGT